MQIPRRSLHCAQCSETFQPDSLYVSHVRQTPDEWIRTDYCPKCWEQVPKKTKEQGHHWFGKIPPKRKKTLSPDERALQLFRQLAEERKEPKLTFVLMLYLQRKKQVALRPQSHVEILETGEVFEVNPVTLSQEEGEAVMEQLQALLHE